MQVRYVEVTNAQVERQRTSHFPGILKVELQLWIVVTRREQFIQFSVGGGLPEQKIRDRVVSEAPTEGESALIGRVDLRFYRCLGKLISAAEFERVGTDCLRYVVGEGHDVVVRPPRVIARIHISPALRKRKVGNFIRTSLNTREEARDVQAGRLFECPVQTHGPPLFRTIVAAVSERDLVEQRRIDNGCRFGQETLSRNIKR